MKPGKALHDLGQSLWLDNITRDLLNSGTLQRYIDELSVTGLTSNPTIFDQAIKNSSTYDADISKARYAKSAEDLFFDLALADLSRAADLFQPIFARTDGVDGWVSLEVSPLLAHDTNATLAAARDLHRREGKPNSSSRSRGLPKDFPPSRRRFSPRMRDRGRRISRRPERYDLFEAPPHQVVCARLRAAAVRLHQHRHWANVARILSFEPMMRMKVSDTTIASTMALR
jgi:hypothetical protein